MRAKLLLGFAMTMAMACSAEAALLGPDFAASYSITDLGSVPGLPPLYGGLTTIPGSPSTLLIGGAANGAAGNLRTIGLTRDGSSHITGFSGTATPYGTIGEYNDGGVVFGPGGVLFTARWPVNALGQTKPGSTDENRVDDVGLIGIASSISALNFVPVGFAGAGLMKVVTYGGGLFYDVAIAPDGSGTFDLLSATLVATLPGGPEGFVYVKGGNPGFLTDSMLVSEYGAGKVAAYEVDAFGNPILATRRDFLTGLTGAEGAYIDPLTGDFLFSTFGGGDKVFRISGFTVPPEPPVGGEVPEPATVGLMALGFLGLACRRKARGTGRA